MNDLYDDTSDIITEMACVRKGLLMALEDLLYARKVTHAKCGRDVKRVLGKTIKRFRIECDLWGKDIAILKEAKKAMAKYEQIQGEIDD